MFTSEQYRVKAAEYAKLVKTANSPDEVREFQKLERSFTELADNGQWVIDNYNQTLHATERSGASEESTLRFPVVTGQAARE